MQRTYFRDFGWRVTNPKKATTSNSYLSDHMLYKQLIDSLMCLVNTKLDICSKTCAQVFEGHNEVLSEISWKW